MINHDNLYDDLKVLFLSSGYLTEDEGCGYDELIFAVRKDYLFEYLKGDEIKTLEDMERWLREEYTSDDTYGLYQQSFLKNVCGIHVAPYSTKSGKA